MCIGKEAVCFPVWGRTPKGSHCWFGMKGLKSRHITYSWLMKSFRNTLVFLHIQLRAILQLKKKKKCQSRGHDKGPQRVYQTLGKIWSYDPVTPTPWKYKEKENIMEITKFEAWWCKTYQTYKHAEEPEYILPLGGHNYMLAGLACDATILLHNIP